MALTAGSLSQVSVAYNLVQASSSAPTGGTTPYLYQWYKSVVSGFTPSSLTSISAATLATLSDSQVVPGTNYYYEVVYTDSNATPLTVSSAQLSVMTLQPVQNPNAFAQSPQLGMIDQHFDYDTMECEVDISQSTPLYAGQAVKMVNSANGVPKVVACTSNTDQVLGFINYDIKSQLFSAGNRCEISGGGNVIYLYATGVISRGAQVCLAYQYLGGVQATGSSSTVVGWAYDQGVAQGTLMRVRLSTPSFATA
jgi:hypothetical protein